MEDSKADWHNDSTLLQISARAQLTKSKGQNSGVV